MKRNSIANKWYDEKYGKKHQADALPGGLADNKEPPDFDPLSLGRGREVEKEHTPDPQIAEKIAMDHLVEHEDYYEGLEDMEKELESEETASTSLTEKQQKFVRNLLKKQTRPTDKEVHSWAEEIGVTVDAIEEYIYLLASEHVTKHTGQKNGNVLGIDFTGAGGEFAKGWDKEGKEGNLSSQPVQAQSIQMDDPQVLDSLPEDMQKELKEKKTGSGLSSDMFA